MLKQRLLTALLLAPLALAGVFLLPLDLFIFFLDLVIVLAAWEWAGLSGFSNVKQRLIYAFSMALAVAGLHVGYEQLPVSLVLSIAVVAWLVALYWVVRFPLFSGWGERWQRGLIGLVVLLPCWLAFVSLKAMPTGEVLILFLFLLIWGADVGAYFAGKRFGKVKLAYKVSPGKTREGVYGGMFVCLCVALGFAFYMELTMLQQVYLLVLALLTGVVSVLGDLFESMLKRHEGIKDSSNLLPGHGGVLDRIDSLTAAAPLFVLGIHYLGQV